MKILVVDDSALMRTTISDILQNIPNAEIKQHVMVWMPSTK